MDTVLADIQKRLDTLEHTQAVRDCMNQYMALCDNLTVGFHLPDLLVLFTEDAIWEGKGSRYAKTFGRYEGRAAIEAMFAKYTCEPAHFELNVHVLGNEKIHVSDDKAKGSWVLVQPSSFTDGRSQLSCARITADFDFINQQWRIAHFQTENLFSRPMQKHWNHSAELPVPE